MAASYRPPEPLPWGVIAGPLAAAEDSLARLDERLRTSPIRAGWIARSHFADALASLALDGELVWLEDLVLHDADMDVRAPTHALSRAHATLRARRRIAAAPPAWALTREGLEGLNGRGERPQGQGREDADGDGEGRGAAESGHDGPGADALAAEMAAIDKLLARSDRLARQAMAPLRSEPPPVDEGAEEDARLAQWRAAVAASSGLPPVLAAALALDAWEALAPPRQAAWLGRQLAAATLRARGKTPAHLPCLNLGLASVRRERRRPQDRAHELAAKLDAIAAAAALGMKEHDRLLLARRRLEHRLAGRRANSKLPSCSTSSSRSRSPQPS